MELIIIALVSAFAAGLTLFSGFGLGTILLPVFALFFHIDVAIGMTAVVHLLNNIFKYIFLRKYADMKIVWTFGIPAIIAAFAGAFLFIRFLDFAPLGSYMLFGRECTVEPVKLLIGILIMLFAVFEMTPSLNRFSLDRKYLPLGGVISGFFGGVSGHQGAFRSIFLLRCGLTKETFIATGVIIACLVDFSRLIIYFSRFEKAMAQDNILLLTVASVCAFAGVVIGNRLLKKITMTSVQIIVGVLLLIIGTALSSGII